jgi:hypothetical protein
MGPEAGLRDLLGGATHSTMAEFADLERRIEALSRQAAARPDAAVLAEMEATLSEGYVRALTAEGRMKQLDGRLDALMERLDPADAAEIRSVARERQQLAKGVERLRARLAEARDGFLALRRG